VRAHIDDANRKPSTYKGLVLVLTNSLLYVLSLAGIVALPWWPAKLLCVALASVWMVALIAVGHDAGHNSLTSRTWLNRLLGRLVMFPALHAFSIWRISHDRGHHDFTNLKGKDFVWAPLCKDEYDRLSLCGRLLHRFYRTFFGVGAFYLIEIWLKNAFARNKHISLKGLNGIVDLLDRMLIVAFAVLQGWGLCAAQQYLAAAFGLPELSVPLVLVLGMLLPFLGFCWLAGFITFQQHTHPKIKWYADRDEWSFFGGAVQGTTHVVMPWPWGIVFHNLMDHPAHHVDPRIPLYNLPKSQKQLEARYADLIIQDFTLASFQRHLATCQLYDYQAHRWLDFAGNPTTARLA
jgi:omega-6 fatty acid desaturase (delta-12 desaturase)